MIDQKALERALELVGGTSSGTRCLGGFDDSVFQVEINQKDYILKFYKMREEESLRLQGELDWITYLYDKGMKVARPMKNQMDTYRAQVQGQENPYEVVLFEKVEGDRIDERNWEKTLIEVWGQAMGRIHHLGKIYVPPDGGKIIRWDESDLMVNPPDHAPEKVIEVWNEYLERIGQLKEESRGFGLIHHDLHHENLYFKEREAYLFDFGDTQYGRFVCDIAISMYHGVLASQKSGEERHEFGELFLKHFMTGYERENKLADGWREELEFFLKYRRIYSYLYLTRHLGEERLTVGVKGFLTEMEEVIINDRPFLEMQRT